MFNMATGSGKTLVMAALILYYYQQGYRHFLFFVNRNNIVDKTENNFLDNTHNKYLFKEKIVIDDKIINLKKVDFFSDDPQGIEIKFTSIQKLYNDIHIEKEGKTTLDDLYRKDIVMLADEAHHLNTDTKSNMPEELFSSEITYRTNAEEVERKGWEHTVIDLILYRNNKGGMNKNILLEFTATIPATEAVAKKYTDKIIYKFGLKEFLQAGYTKEINLISSVHDKRERVLLALFFQWYRHKIALKHGIANFKPVILFRSKTIDQSWEDYTEFLNWTDNVSSDDLDFLKNIRDKINQAKQPELFEAEKSRVEILLDFVETEQFHWGEIANWIKQSYRERNTIITNSKTNKKQKEITDEETEKLLNSLEDKNNHVRAIFTVDRLTEGWDVLNLFDIVRLYEGQNAGGRDKKTPEATIKEKQLIGRGVRYFPFVFSDKIQNKRKFDNDLTHELRVLEELHYYTYDEESRYISHLKNELRKDGYISDNRVIKTFGLKKEFQESSFFKTVKIWYNNRIDNPHRRKKDFKDIEKNFFPPYRIRGFELTEQEVNLERSEDRQKLNLQEKEGKTITITFDKIEKHIVRKAINIKAQQENSLFQFEKLMKERKITSIDELQEKLADQKITIILGKNKGYEDIDNHDKLNLMLKFLDCLLKELEGKIVPKIGSEFVIGEFKKFFAEPKIKTIEENERYSRIAEYAKDFEKQKWYVLDTFHGTSEEIELIEFIKNTMGNLEDKFQEIYLLRNEEVYKIFDFEQGRGFQPDFILFLKTKDKKKIRIAEAVLYYQIFIEAKGDEFQLDGSFKGGKEGWKEEFLEAIAEKYGLENVIEAENPNYRLIGLPFFNKGHSSSFESKFREIYES